LATERVNMTIDYYNASQKVESELKLEVGLGL
jgi:hypothetical protein